MKKTPSRLLTIFLFITSLTTATAVIRNYNTSTTDKYVTIKIAQGLWWSESTTNGPPAWLLQKLLSERSNKSQPTITNIEYYPTGIYPNTNDLDIYITFLLPTRHNPTSNTYSYDRSPLAVGAPINLDLPTTTLNGTIIDISDQPPTHNTQEILITITKKQSEPWEKDAIKVGDSLTNGEETIFEVTSVKSTPTYSYDKDIYGNTNLSTRTTTYFLEVEASLRVTKVQDLFIFAHEQPVIPGNNLELSTPNFNYSYFEIASVTDPNSK